MLYLDEALIIFAFTNELTKTCAATVVLIVVI